ncbi:MAG TPA: CHAT domain-containing protein [Bryobacteraceae bacterium]|nr:CHAT domain-containing protein [Bryobacteraceae bacterium]
MPNGISFVDLTKRLAQRNQTFHERFVAGMSLMSSGNPAGSIPILAECEAEAQAIVQDQTQLFQMQQAYWSEQLASVLLEKGTACMLAGRLPEARETVEALGRLIPRGGSQYQEARLAYLVAQLIETGILPGNPIDEYDSAIDGFEKAQAWQNAAQASRLAAIWVLRNGNYQAFRTYSARAAAIAEQHGLPSLAINFRTETARSELLAANTAQDLNKLRQEIDFDTDLKGAIAGKLSALYAGVHEAFASFSHTAPEAAELLRRLAGYARDFGLAYPAWQLDQLQQPSAMASSAAVVKDAGQKVDAAYASLRVDALLLAAEFKLRLNDPDTAHDALDQAERSAGGDAALLRSIYMDRSAVFEAEKNMPEAIRAAEMAVEVSGNLPAVAAEQAVLALNRLRQPTESTGGPLSIEDQVNVLLQEAFRCFGEKQPEAALSAIGRGLEIVKTDAQRRMLLGHHAIANIELGRFEPAIADAAAAIALFDQPAADGLPSPEDLRNRIAEEENLYTMKAVAEAKLGRFDRAWLAAEQGKATMLKRDIARRAGRAIPAEGADFAVFRKWLASERAAVLAMGAPTRWGTLVITAGPDDVEPLGEILPLTGAAVRELFAGGDLFERIPLISAALLHPLGARLLAITKRARVLYVMPAAQFFEAPFAALSMEEGGGARALADLCPVAWAPSAAILLWCAAQRDPQRSRSLLAAGTGEAGAYRFSDQARRVAVMDWPAGHEQLLDQAATASNFASRAPLYSTLYIAAHGVLNSDVHETLAASEIQFADRCLSAREVLEWRLDADLVFLNACQSGLFRGAGQSQVNGFFRAFPAAGARTVVVALAYIDPGTAGELAEAFFRAWLGGAAKIDALHQAQQQIRKKPEVTARDWAAHCLLGDYL